MKKIFIILAFVSFLDARLVNLFTEEEKQEWSNNIMQKSPEHIQNVESTTLSFIYLIKDDLRAWYADNIFLKKIKAFKLSAYKPFIENVVFSEDNELISPDGKPCIKINVDNDYLILKKGKNTSEVCKDTFDYYKLKNELCRDLVDNQTDFQKDKHYLLTGKYIDLIEDYGVCSKYDLSKNDNLAFKLSLMEYSTIRAYVNDKLKRLKEAIKNQQDLKEFFMYDNTMLVLQKPCIRLENNKIILNKDLLNADFEGKDAEIYVAFLYSWINNFKDTLLKNGSIDIEDIKNL